MPLEKAEYDRIVTNCFNVHGLPDAVFKAIAKEVVGKIDNMLNEPTKFNKALKAMIKNECKSRSEGESNVEALVTRIGKAERTSQTLEKDLGNLRAVFITILETKTQSRLL